MLAANEKQSRPNSRRRTRSKADTVSGEGIEFGDQITKPLEQAARSAHQALFNERARILMESVVDHKKTIKHLHCSLQNFKNSAAIQATQTGREKIRLEETQSRVLRLERDLEALQAKSLSSLQANVGLEER